MAFSDLFFSSLITFLFLDFNRSDRKGQLGPGKIPKSHLCIPNFHFHVSVSDLHIPRICPQTPHIFRQQNRQTDPGNRYCTSHGNWLWPHNFFSENVCFEFSVLCLYARYLNVYTHINCVWIGRCIIFKNVISQLKKYFQELRIWVAPLHQVQRRDCPLWFVLIELCKKFNGTVSRDFFASGNFV